MDNAGARVVGVPDLRPLRDTDLADVLTLNDRNVVKLAAMDEARLHELRELADRFDVLDVDGAFAGFVITFAPGTAYDSENYRWFAERRRSFYYLDRIVLHEDFRRRAGSAASSTTRSSGGGVVPSGCPSR